MKNLFRKFFRRSRPADKIDHRLGELRVYRDHLRDAARTDKQIDELMLQRIRAKGF